MENRLSWTTIVGLHLQEFNREFLSTPADRREVIRAVLGLAAALAAFFYIVISRWPLWF